jgi:hypothetical protein
VSVRVSNLGGRFASEQSMSMPTSLLLRADEVIE